MAEPRKKKQKNSTTTYINRIKVNLVNPTHTSMIPKSDDLESWKKHNQNLQERIEQIKIDTNWSEFYSRFYQSYYPCNSIKNQNFISEHEKTKEINRKLRETIPSSENLNSETSCWRKSYDNINLIIEAAKKNCISIEEIIDKLSHSKITINYFQEVNKEDLDMLINCLVGK
ncbi:739_t:CDS:2, partial [Dentiscutata erythropus]